MGIMEKNTHKFKTAIEWKYEAYFVGHDPFESSNPKRIRTFVYFFIPGNKGMMT